MVIFGKHIDKLDADKAKGIHTLPVINGRKGSPIFHTSHDDIAIPTGSLPCHYPVLFPGSAPGIPGTYNSSPGLEGI